MAQRSLPPVHREPHHTGTTLPSARPQSAVAFLMWFEVFPCTVSLSVVRVASFFPFSLGSAKSIKLSSVSPYNNARKSLVSPTDITNDYSSSWFLCVWPRTDLANVVGIPISVSTRLLVLLFITYYCMCRMVVPSVSSVICLVCINCASPTVIVSIGYGAV